MRYMYEPFNKAREKYKRLYKALKLAALIGVSVYAMDRLSCYNVNDVIKVGNAMVEKAQEENITPQEAYKKLNIENILKNK